MKSEKCKFGRAIIATVVILAALAFVLVGSASALTIYVPTDYPTIQQAIDAASPGDTVFVYNGTYYEGNGVSISKNRITLQGEDKNSTTIHGKWTAEKVVYVTGNYVNVSVFSVTGSREEGYEIYVDSGDNCVISDNIIIGGNYGIYLRDSDSSTVSHNNASNTEMNGICLVESSECLIENNIANSTRFYGIVLSSSSNCNLKNNTANLNYYFTGISLSSSSNCNLENNIANSNDGGIHLAFSSNCNLENNIANSNHDDGILLFSSSNCNITTNTAHSNGRGIYLKSTSINNNITENNISNNREYGMYLDYSGNNEIYHNNFINNDKQAYDHHGFNEWDKGPLVGGNYWSDHVCHGNPSNGTEPYRGIDTDAGAVDNYPFEDPDGWTSIPTPTGSFDTGSGGYPSIMGNHTGTIKPNHTVIATKMYTYPCSGTGGHTEHVKIWNSTWNATAIWDGYVGDWHNISFSEPFTLKEGIKYNYTIITGSYPQIHHTDRLKIDDGEITCAAFIDANGKRHNNWIPAIRLE